MGLKLIGERVLVKPIIEAEKTKGGIIIPDNAKEKPQSGIVSAVGTGGKDDNGKVIELEVKKGDKVLYGKYAGTETKYDDVDYLILRMDEIIAIIE